MIKLSENQHYIAYAYNLSMGYFSEAKNCLQKIIDANQLDKSQLVLLYALMAKIDIENGDIISRNSYIQKILGIFPDDDFWINDILNFQKWHNQQCEQVN